MKRILAFTLALMMCVCLFGCKESDSEAQTTTATETTSGETVKVEMSVTDFGKITLELYPDIAPITVENFVKLVNEKFYDGLTFHRIMKDFMIQGGDPSGDGTGGSKDTIKGEFTANGVTNNLSHDRGVISMARVGGQNNSASSQFFIVHGTNCQSSLDGQYASFGKVIDGMDVVDAIANVKVNYNAKTQASPPVTPVVIEYIKVID